VNVKMRIVIIDNDAKARSDLQVLLSSHEHAPISLGTITEQTAQNVHDQEHELALVDIRMISDTDPDDDSGKVFAIELCALGTPTVLVTNHPPDAREIFDLIWTGKISGILKKTTDPHELAKCVDEFKLSRRLPNGVAKFMWMGHKDEFSPADWQRVRSPLGSIGDEADFAVLFRSLIPPFAHTVELHPISPGHGGTALYRARVSCGDGPVVEEVAIKYGTRELIRSEAMRYDRYAGPLPDGVAAHLRWRKETKLLGALAYSWVGDSIEDGVPLGPVGSKHTMLTWRRRRAALERLFSVSLDPWYRVYRSETARLESPITLLAYYTGEDGYCGEVPFHGKPLPDGLASPISKDESEWDFGVFGRFTDPTRWLTIGEGSRLSLTKFCPSHGDLHVRNIFVMPDDSPRLIDFGDTGPGHVFRDFASLEASVRLTCCSCSDTLALKDATDRLSQVVNLGEHIDYRGLRTGMAEYEDLRESLRLVMQIRRAALDVAGAGQDAAATLREYLFALTLRMLRYADGRVDEFPPTDPSAETDSQRAERKARTWHALYGAAKAVECAERLVSSRLSAGR
jgi:DNA-binding NarL/FixJ family response regulator